MEKYRLVQEHKADQHEDFLEESGSLPVVRITQQGKPRNYISYAMNLFVRLPRFDLFVMYSAKLTAFWTMQSDGANAIVLKAMGRAINKAVTIAEILKRKMPLHQLNSLSSVEMVDVYEPVEEGLDVVTSRRYVSCMKITLSLSADGFDTTHAGYQAPLAGDEINPGDLHPQQQTPYSSSMVSTM